MADSASLSRNRPPTLVVLATADGVCIPDVGDAEVRHSSVSAISIVFAQKAVHVVYKHQLTSQHFTTRHCPKVMLDFEKFNYSSRHLHCEMLNCILAFALRCSFFSQEKLTRDLTINNLCCHRYHNNTGAADNTSAISNKFLRVTNEGSPRLAICLHHDAVFNGEMRGEKQTKPGINHTQRDASAKYEFQACTLVPRGLEQHIDSARVYSWCMLTAVHSRCTQQEPVTTVQPREIVRPLTSEQQGTHHTRPVASPAELCSSGGSVLVVAVETSLRGNRGWDGESNLHYLAPTERRMRRASEQAHRRGVAVSVQSPGSQGEISCREHRVAWSPPEGAFRSTTAPAPPPPHDPTTCLHPSDLLAFTACEDHYTPFTVKSACLCRPYRTAPRLLPLNAQTTYVHLGEPDSIPDGVVPGFSHVIFVPDNAADRRIVSGDLPYPPPLHSGAAPYLPRFTLVRSQDLDVKSRPNLFTR
ncbi:hypothetical protein PR048_000821 [Dryococelus australis]|uniref:Uncharacterized protein n=1 Tax=Dryococelus australis TaxID=614101 RepID=A0ABQ9IFP1_9NEOP|nr:hypothetical protein PR048_000821 [Dryococelus australis]